MSAARRTVLIVDDDAGVIQIFSRMLNLAGYDVVTALDAETGLREMGAARPDAILLDLRMPLMDGLAFLRRMRAQEQDRHTPVAIISGDYHIDQKLIGEFIELGAVLCFKPLGLEDLVGIIERLLQSSH